MNDKIANTTQGENLRQSEWVKPTSQEYRQFCHSLNDRWEHVEFLAKRLHDLCFSASWGDESQYEKDFWKMIARAVLFEQQETRPVNMGAVCPKCGNYYGGHAAGADDICTCYQENQYAKEAV